MNIFLFNVYFLNLSFRPQPSTSDSRICEFIRLLDTLPSKVFCVLPSVLVGNFGIIELLIGDVEPIPEGEPAVVGVEGLVVEVVELGRVDVGKMIARVFVKLGQG